MKNIYFCIPVSNEEENLENCISSISNSTSNLKNIFSKVFICLNGCKDNSQKIAKQCNKKYPQLNISIIKSKKGKLNAQEKVLSHIPENNLIFFIDSDTTIDKKSIKIILKEFKKNKHLLAIGAFPVAKKYKGFNLWKKFLDNVLNIRSRHPRSEISKFNVEDYHSLAKFDPQKINTSKNHELKSKIFFHGRMFALKSKKYWNKPSKNKKIVGDDSYLPDYIIHNYGKNRIRIRYDAKVYFQPFVSLKSHYKSYKRIYFDLYNLNKNFPEFVEIRKKSNLILDKNYINNQKNLTKFYFYCFILIRKIEKILFKISFEKNPEKIWKD